MNCGEPLRFPNGRTTFFRCLQRTTTTATSNTTNHPISDWIHAAAEGEDELGQATHQGSLSRPKYPTSTKWVSSASTLPPRSIPVTGLPG
ncbi:uncharacterized protein CCOS01_11396 [Colletotrichum costaricense]|uniref:Uncharacterized protein n=1 Tax=Colletotrichum costaricense TaxID=1209916 RepID=A0AAJ0DX86_9PEZI|nr:uncharacterized protein CCOS01_11396 [Colletotrichum costaricense]KAK1519745.1 hypothetical protein CCOS01_11396 [Colletotrichum costaricense]